MDVRQYVNHSCRVLDSSIEPWEAYWKEFEPTIPKGEWKIYRFWTNRGWLTGFIRPDMEDEKDDDYQLIKDYGKSLQIYTNARELGRNARKNYS